MLELLRPGAVCALYQFCVIWNFRKVGYGEARVIDTATIVGKPVADEEVVGVEDAVVAGYLIEYFLGDGDVGGFVFYDDARRSSFAVVEHAVATAQIAAYT